MKSLQSTNPMALHFLDDRPLQVTPAPHVLCTDFRALGEKIQCPMTAHIGGVVDYMGPLRHTKDSAQMVEVR